MVVKKLRGFTLAEILIVITIIMLLAIAVLLSLQNQTARANDAKRKDHIKKFRIAFEDYYNDNQCYPNQTMWDGFTCDSADFSPYMDTFFCDPVTKQKYYLAYFQDEDGVDDPCRGYKLYAKLQYTGDPDIASVGCGTAGCGVGSPLSSYNYGFSVGGRLTAVDFNPNLTPIPTPTLRSVSAPGPIGDNFCLGGDNPGKDCNFKSGCAIGFDNRKCVEVLVNEYGCQSFVDGSDCQTQCKNNYESVKCAATATLTCGLCSL